MEKAGRHTSTLPPLHDLFTDSWRMFKGSLLNVFLINIIAFGIYIALIIVGVLIALPFGLFSFFNAMANNKLTPESLSSLGVLGLIIFVLIIAFIIISYVIQAATIMVVANYKNKPKLGKTLRQSFSYVLPLFLVGIVTGFISAGGYFLLIIPGLLIQILFAFVMYEIVLSKKGVLSSIRHSMGIVMAHFWGVLGRILLWICIVLAISILPNVVMSRGGGELSFIFTIINVLVGWYGISYSITLYEQARHGQEHTEKKLLWPLLVGILGWIVAIVIISTLISVLPGVISSISKESKKTNTSTPVYQMDAMPSSSPSSIPSGR